MLGLDYAEAAKLVRERFASCRIQQVKAKDSTYAPALE